MEHQNKNCPFCSDTLVAYKERGSVLAFYDNYPVTPGHLLIIPKAHKKDFFELSSEEKTDSMKLIEELKSDALSKDPSISGFNIGANCGESAGQTIFHCHIHLIPRRDGDCEDPRGGVRGVIASKQKY